VAAANKAIIRRGRRAGIQTNDPHEPNGSGV
jgi:hypothetical protein